MVMLPPACSFPGLLQTPAYGSAMVRGVLPTAVESEVAERVEARAERQKLLDGPAPLALWAVVDEAAIRRVVGGRRVMAAQLDHVVSMTRRPNVTVQVIPFDVGAHPGMPGSFVHMEFRDEGDPELVYVDTMAGDIFLESEEDLRRYRTMFDHLRASALSPARSAALITTIKEGLLE
jgi:hypothetical protein